MSSHQTPARTTECEAQVTKLPQDANWLQQFPQEHLESADDVDWHTRLGKRPMPSLLGVPFDALVVSVRGCLCRSRRVEYNPVQDVSGMTATAAAKIVKEIWGKVIAQG
jgi:hypothetical protein